MVTVSRGNGISIKGIRKLDLLGIWAVDRLEEYLESPRAMRPWIRTGITESVSDIDTGGAWGGGRVSGGGWRPAGPNRDWQPLSEYTNDKREERGYPREEPIMWQSGQLFQAAVVPFARWGYNTRRSSRSFNAPYGNHSNVKMNATVGGRRFHAQISGSRVANQYGGKIKKPSGYTGNTRGTKQYLPARPFWYLTQMAMDDARVGFSQDLSRVWAKAAIEMRLT